MVFFQNAVCLNDQCVYSPQVRKQKSSKVNKSRINVLCCTSQKACFRSVLSSRNSNVSPVSFSSSLPRALDPSRRDSSSRQHLFSVLVLVNTVWPTFNGGTHAGFLQTFIAGNETGTSGWHICYCSQQALIKSSGFSIFILKITLVQFPRNIQLIPKFPGGIFKQRSMMSLNRSDIKICLFSFENLFWSQHNL